MKPSLANRFNSSIVTTATAAFALALTCYSASAATGTWTQLTSGGLWSAPANWSGGTIADLSGFTANFNTLDLVADNTVQLDSDRTLTGLTFGDTTTTTAGGWILANNSVATNNLILAGTSPTITVSTLGTAKTATISAIIEGTVGFTKAGAGDLVLSGTNSSFSGPVSITGGALTLDNNTSALGTTSGVTMANATNLRLNGTASATLNYNFPIHLTSGNATIKNFQGIVSPTLNLGGTISGLGGLVLSNEAGGAAVTLNFGLQQPNTYAGNTSIIASAGTNIVVKLGTQNALPTTTTLTIDQGSGNNGTSRTSALDLGGFNQTIAGLVSSNNNFAENAIVRNTGGPATLTINNNSGTSRMFIGKIQQTGVLNVVKTGATNQSLASNNSYTGTTAVNGGTLTLDFVRFGSILTNTPSNYINPTSALELGGGTFAIIGRANGSAAASTAWTGGTSNPVITFTTIPAGLVVGQAITAGTGITGAGTTAYIVGIDTTNNRISLNGNAGAVSGTFETAATTVTTSQTFASTTVNAGRSGLSINTNSGSGTVLTLNAITRNVGGTLDFAQPSLSITNGYTTSTPNTAGTILGGWATVAGANWATNDGTKIVALGSYTLTSAAGTSAGSYAAADIDVDSSAGLLDGTITPNSLRFNAAAANTVTLAAGNNSITSGGILVSSNVGANVSTITGGTLLGAAGTDLVITQTNTGGNLIIQSKIDYNTTATALTKSGAGPLVLTAANTYSGTTYLNEGTVVVSAANNLGAPASNLLFNGGTLQISGTALTSFSSLGRTISVTPAKNLGLSIADPTNTFTVDQVLSHSTGGFSKAGTGKVILNQVNTYTGPTTISNGTVILSGSGTLGSGANLNLAGGQLDLGGFSQTVGTVSISGAFASGDTILNGSLTGTSYLATNATGNAIISANLLANGTIGFAKSGAGTLSLTGNNTYTGTNTISAGVLKIGSTNAFSGGGNVNLAGGVLGLGVGDRTFSTLGTAAGNLQWTASGGFAAYGADRTVTIGTPTTSINWTATSFIGAGNELLLSAADSDATITFNKEISFAGGARTINVANGSSAIDAKMGQVISGGTSGTSNIFVKSGTGTLALTNNGNLYFGNTNITAGTLMLGDGTVNTGRISANSPATAVSANATLAVNRNGATTQLTDLSNDIISGAGSFSQVGSGTTTLTLVNTYSGATTITAGTLALGASNVLPNAVTSTMAIGPGTLSVGAGFTDTVGTLKVTGAATITLGDASSKLAFADSSDPLITWTGSLNITGPIVYGASGSIRFGTSAAALRPDQLALITVAGGGTFGLDSNGYLIEAAPGGFSTWIAGSGFVNGSVPVDKRGPNDDFDNDGISNLVEYGIKDQDPTVSNASIGTFNGTTLSFDKRLDATGLTYAIQDSTDLGIVDFWAEVPAGPFYVNNGTTIAYTLTPGTPEKNFLRLQVLSN